MNLQTINRSSAAGVGLLLVSVIFAVLTVAVKVLVTPAPIDADRDAIRAKALSEVRAAEAAAINTPGWVDQSHGVVRLPIATAEQLAAQAWQNPSAARADLTARAEKASAPLPKAPEKPSAFE